MLEVAPGIVIEDSALEEHFVRASGPGGQNVNKVATAVQLRFDVGRSSLAPEVVGRLRELAGTRMTEDGVLIIDARSFRTQAENREAARARLLALVRKALVPPKRRRRTKPPRASIEKRIEGKRRRAETKRRRASRDDE